MEVDEQDAEPQRHLARLGLKTRQEGHDLELLVVALVQVMLPGEERIPALVPRQAHHGVLLVQGADHVGFETLLVGDEEAYFHVAFPMLEVNGWATPYRKAFDAAMLGGLSDEKGNAG